MFGLMQDHSEAIVSPEAQRRSRTATVEFEDFIDYDPLDPEREPVRVHLQADKAGRLAHSSTSASSDPQPKAPIGCTRPLTLSAVFVSTLNLLLDIPFNHGFIRNIEILTTPGICRACCSPARWRAAPQDRSRR